MYSEKPKLHDREKAFKPGNLRTIALDVTPVCNMYCPHCYADTFRYVEPIELDVLKRALDEAYQLGVLHYVLQGGEPIVDPKRLEAIIGMCYPDETYINVVSNGWAMTVDRIRWLKELKVDKITFSLDSGVEEEHDAGRGQGSYARVIKAVDNVLAEGLITSISTVVTHQSLHAEGFKKAFEFAKSKGIRVDIQIAEPVGMWDGKKEYLVTPEDSQYLKEIYLNGPRLPNNGASMIKRDLYRGDYDHCPAGTEFMAITTDGNVLPCNFLQYTLGNIRDKSVAEMRRALLTSHWFDDSHPLCICGEDHDFIDTFIMPYVGQPKPLDAYEVFGLKIV